MKEETPIVLVVDDEFEIQRLFKQIFRKKIRDGNIDFRFAQNGVEALQILRESNEIDMVLTDIQMPEMDGLTLLANLAEFDYPLKAVVISAFGDMRNIRAAMNRGAFDFLNKPFDFADLEITISKTLACVQELREQKQQLQSTLDRLHSLVFYDQLTGLINRYGLLQEIAHSIEDKHVKGSSFVILKLDVERYSIIKSGFGHALSDLLLVKVAHRLNNLEIPSKVVARLENNEFALLIRKVDLSCVDNYIQQLHHLFQLPIQFEEINVSSKIHIGVVTSDLEYSQPEDFLRAADTAIDHARHAKNRTVFFKSSMQQKAVHRVNLEVSLQEAIETHQIQIYYQPIISLATGKINSFEALARWITPTQKLISPLEFIPLAEETGLIIPLGRLILSEACTQMGKWKKMFPEIYPTSISVNLSSLQLVDPILLDDIDRNLSFAELQGENLTLEITESVLMENKETAIDVLSQLRQRSIGLSIDDFGTGYSSLAYLQSLPITTLKIDRAFVKDIDVNSNNLEITSMIINLAKQLKLKVVAEGIQTESHTLILKDLFCDYGQGFLYSRPVDVTAATALIHAQSIL
ncbi:putative bifunctional diguanylate cyclase/phosphodiesterase [Pseudanabaena sp. ABRG5-3]|uniref:putative bifunctional diguanylate cyclase/phosphodiesterase n=1 Tax=Pseudanabaena sp. ABRG5-3 TaxID=685565 RepID=UPI000DC731DB|nr:EAL domain-containing response regulator [Pseudanabaena sp. ABRG5-3]BBC23452.1 response regulator receiver modulated diguanylate cyclase/phosphodiesterase [Pseudanabaena sp. ABRG5-3]